MKHNSEERIQRLKEAYEGSEPFTDPDCMPDFPIADREEDRKWFEDKFIELGAIPKSQLVVGANYLGNCRNASKAKWLGDRFEYQRYKFGFTYSEYINHFQDDDGYDVFVPIKKLED